MTKKKSPHSGLQDCIAMPSSADNTPRQSTKRSSSKKMKSSKKELQEKVYEQVMFERRVLLGCTVLIGVAIIMWIVAISTDNWILLDGGAGIYIPETKRYFLHSNSGIWRICRHVFSNGTARAEATAAALANATEVFNRTEKFVIHKYCWNHVMFSSPNKAGDPATDTTIVDYNRTEGVSSAITLLLMVLGFIFSCYCFKNPRYMFKRTAGGLHFLSTGASFTVIEVLINSIEYERTNLPFIYPEGAKSSYGFSFVLAWLVFVCNLVSGVMFMVYSRKRKGKKAPTEELGLADEPTIIGR